MVPFFSGTIGTVVIRDLNVDDYDYSIVDIVDGNLEYTLKLNSTKKNTYRCHLVVIEKCRKRNISNFQFPHFLDAMFWQYIYVGLAGVYTVLEAIDFDILFVFALDGFPILFTVFGAPATVVVAIVVVALTA